LQLELSEDASNLLLILRCVRHDGGHGVPRPVGVLVDLDLLLKVALQARVACQLELDERLVARAIADLEVNRPASCIWLPADIKVRLAPDESEEELDFGLFGERLPRTIDNAVTVLMLYVMLEEQDAFKCLVVACPWLLVEVGLGLDVRERSL
jgi:hypothetical protein